LADAGPLFAAADRHDQYHDRARSELARLERERRPVVVSYSTSIEGQGLIPRQIGVRLARTWLAQVVADAILINPEPEDYLAAVVVLDRYPDQGLTLADAVLAVLSRRYALPVWTYDQHCDVMGAAVWRYRPGGE
jgi:predicted nucleic acid-binding protein